MSHNTHGALAFLACVACSLAPAIGAEQAPIPDFAPNRNVGWVASGEGFGADFVQPPSGPGPVTNDPAYPHPTNEDAARIGRQPTYRVADFSNPILRPWAKERMRKANEQAGRTFCCSRQFPCVSFRRPHKSAPTAGVMWPTVEGRATPRRRPQSKQVPPWRPRSSAAESDPKRLSIQLTSCNARQHNFVRRFRQSIWIHRIVVLSGTPNALAETRNQYRHR
jgi:hypothetical protein